MATNGYVAVVGWMLRGSLVVLLVYAAMIYGTWHLFTVTPSGFIPPQDKGYLVLNVRLADSASLERTQEIMAKVENLAGSISGVRHTVALAGQSLLLNANAPNFGSMYVNDFNRFGRTWQVNVQADAKYRMQTQDLQRMYVISASAGTVPLASFIRITPVTGPLMIIRHNLYQSAFVNADTAVGASSGEAIASLKRIANENLAPSMRAEYTELAFLQQLAGNTAMYAFLLAVILVFLVLAAQYESWALPLAVILVVPMCLLCSVIGVIAAGMDINIFTQIGFVVLVGLACKNAILIVEYARSRNEEGVSVYEATLDACRLRLRPIIMTSFAFIFGVVPLVLGEGAGAEMRRTLGTAVFAGMLGVTLFGILLTPVFFYVIQRLANWQSLRTAKDLRNDSV